MMNTRVFLLTVAVIGCSPFTPTRAEQPAVSYAGGDGSSLEKAIVIKAPDEVAGLNAEQTYISIHYGKYKTVDQGLELKKERRFDIITFKTSDGKKHILYFDITDFYGKGFEPSKDN
jgi:hypothetical protein